ncbi:drug resistance transporter, EmrB/QacA subfamily [Pseudonocardia oroxyli]|uniref:Drug resistance transporter, EmrB/QacA subfamily n=2 Tax=Pseudonocardia oroxyli TaxID=366584 RepID=A0A1G7VH64_PSEOR|nr:drug resistance transporter, EmrB/QacA subfamily [Pseudonocardia oroxyli]
MIRMSTPAPHPGRWAALFVIALAQLMVVLDATIVNIALPQAQAHLGISDADRQWVVTAYTLAFGGLLLLGGRIADFWGRKRTFVVGALGFALASGLGGLAQDALTLFAARGLQGVFGALLAPAGLALLTVLFTEPGERAKAFSVFGAVAGGGSAVGLVLGGVLTEYADWRWCLLVNIPISVVAVALALVFVPESRADGDTRYDVPGAVTVTLGLVALVYGFTRASEDGWSAPWALGSFGAAVVLLVAFVVIEQRSSHPLVPLALLVQRDRGGAYLFSTLVGAGLLGAFLFLTFYFQIVLGYTPLQAGLASLPVTGGVLVAAGVASQLMPRIGPKPLMVTGGLVAAAGMILLTLITPDSSFLTLLLPAQLVLGLGLGLSFVPLASLALVGVGNQDAGAASAVLNATQQVGASLGTALLNTIATTAAASRLAEHPITDPSQTAEVAVYSYVVAFAWAAALLLIGTALIMVLVRAGRREVATPQVAHLG